MSKYQKLRAYVIVGSSFVGQQWVSEFIYYIYRFECMHVGNVFWWKEEKKLMQACKPDCILPEFCLNRDSLG